jgi:DNA-directed RNA polymerase subunit M/transcription elongation factor TFIIS
MPLPDQSKREPRVAKTAAELARAYPGRECPKCGKAAMYYVQLLSSSGHQCKACGWLEF